MNIVFKELQLHNFASFRDTTISLCDMGYTLISGRNHCKLDNAYSNGSGKSTLFNALCYALTGETVQGQSNGIENIFADPNDCWVKVSLTVDGVDFGIKRVKTPYVTMKIYKDGEDISGKGVRESTAILHSYIPELTSTMVSSIIILGQGLPNKFSKNKPSSRKEILETLTKSDYMIQSIKDSLESRLDCLKTSKNDIAINKSADDRELSVLTDQLDKVLIDLNECKKLDLSELDALKDSESKINAEKEDYASKIDCMNARLNELISSKADADNEFKQLYEDVCSKYDLDINENLSTAMEIKATIKAIKAYLASCKDPSGKCPTCGQSLPEMVISSKSEELKASEDELSRVNAIISDLKKSKEEALSIISSEHNDKLSKEANEMSDLNSSIHSYLKKVSELNDLAISVNDKIASINNMTHRIATLEDDVENISCKIEQLKDKLNSLEAEQLYVSSHIEVVQMLLTLAKREFRGVLLSNVIRAVDSKVKQYSKSVFNTDKLDFKLNDNNIDITYCDKLYENLSGGEQQKIDIIIQLALRDILSKQLGVHSNLLVLDEVYDGLDEVSCQMLNSLISNLADIDSVFIISHHVGDLGLSYDNNMLVEKDESGISSVSFV